MALVSAMLCYFTLGVQHNDSVIRVLTLLLLFTCADRCTIWSVGPCAVQQVLISRLVHI